MMTVLYPMIMRPFYRYGQATPWGGDGLNRYLGKDIPDAHTGESLEISALPGMESIVENGALAGTPLGAVFSEYGARLTGIPGGKEFPLLVKLIHTDARPSVQVHPDDVYARKACGKLGKTEAWVILHAPEKAKLVTGANVHSKEEFMDYVARDEIEQCLDMTHVKTGDVYYIPHGQLHASAEGILLYEIQQSSDITYRFYDWNRVDDKSRKRLLHLDDALNVVRFDLHARPLCAAVAQVEGGTLSAYIANENFELWRVDIEAEIMLPFVRCMHMITALDDLEMTWGENRVKLPRGTSALIPFEMEKGVVLRGNGQAILSTLPDRSRLYDLLGASASGIISNAISIHF